VLPFTAAAFGGVGRDLILIVSRYVQKMAWSELVVIGCTRFGAKPFPFFSRAMSSEFPYVL
jgi:hypothetical protein